MTITEKAAYLKGLVEGNALDPEFGEGKLWHVLSELVSDMASELAELREDQNSLSDSLEEVEVGLDYLEELLQDGYDEYDSDTDDEDEDEDEDYYPFGSGNFHVVDSDDEEDAEDDDGGLHPVPELRCYTGIRYEGAGGRKRASGPGSGTRKRKGRRLNTVLKMIRAAFPVRAAFLMKVGTNHDGQRV